MGDGTRAAEEAQEIVGLFRALRRHLVQSSRAELARSGLTAAQLSVISLLGTTGPLTLGELGRRLELSHSTVSGVVDRLEAKGVVQRTPDPDDRRYVRVALADRIARTGLPLADDGPVHRLEAALTAATDDERRRMLDGLALLRRFVESTSG